MRTKSSGIDMSCGPIFKNIMFFVVPLIFGNILQLLYNAADIIVVSRWAGSDAMASVGSTGSLSNLIVSVFIGLSIGASVVVSKNYGAKNYEGIYRAVHTSVILAFFVGIAASISGIALSKVLLSLMGTPEGKVLDGATLYMRIYFIGVPATVMYNFGAAILRAVGDTKRPLYILTATGIVNVVLNLIFVINFHMGVAGVAIATAVSNYLSALAVLYSLMKTDDVYKLCLRELKFYKQELKQIVKIGLPAGVQSSVFSLSNSVIQSAVNSFGTPAIAGSSASGNIEGFIYTTMNAFYQATLTSVSQNYGAQKEKRVYQSIYISILCVTVAGGVLGLLCVFFATPLLSIYITDSPEAIEFGISRMFYTGLPYFFCGIMEVMSGALRGIGHSTIAMINSLVGACGLRILWIMFILPLNRTIETLFLCWPISWIVVIILHTIFFLAVRKSSLKNMLNA